ncbi:DUF3823 domain-containing protein [Parabacteroides sp. OttesenSCG-928-N08]|nr:DUF3823 domain-containing protein [Parabacteroides sp. OttesenSCG-928-N08]
MKLILKHTLFFLLLALSACSYFEIDNFEEPDSGIQGTVVDKKSGQPLLSETGYSYKIEYYEMSWEAAGHENTQSRYFWGKGDGTFMNSKIFAGTYRLTLKEGAFHEVEPREVELRSGKLTEVNYEVIPFARVFLEEVTTAADNPNNLVIKYRVEDTEGEIDTETIDEDLFLLSEARVFISSKSPNVGVSNTESNFTLNARKDLSRYTPGIPKSYTETNVKGLPSGTWWVRVGARTDNPQKRYNFSEVFEITIP